MAEFVDKYGRTYWVADPPSVTHPASTVPDWTTPGRMQRDPSFRLPFIDMDEDVHMVSKVQTIKELRNIVANATIHERFGNGWGVPDEGQVYTEQEVSRPLLRLAEAKRVVEELYAQGYRLVKMVEK